MGRRVRQFSEPEDGELVEEVPSASPARQWKNPLDNVKSTQLPPEPEAPRPKHRLPSPPAHYVLASKPVWEKERDNPSRRPVDPMHHPLPRRPLSPPRLPGNGLDAASALPPRTQSESSDPKTRKSVSRSPETGRRDRGGDLRDTKRDEGRGHGHGYRDEGSYQGNGRERENPYAGHSRPGDGDGRRKGGERGREGKSGRRPSYPPEGRDSDTWVADDRDEMDRDRGFERSREERDRDGDRRHRPHGEGRARDNDRREREPRERYADRPPHGEPHSRRSRGASYERSPPGDYYSSRERRYDSRGRGEGSPRRSGHRRSASPPRRPADYGGGAPRHSGGGGRYRDAPRSPPMPMYGGDSWSAKQHSDRGWGPEDSDMLRNGRGSSPSALPYTGETEGGDLQEPEDAKARYAQKFSPRSEGDESKSSHSVPRKALRNRMNRDRPTFKPLTPPPPPNGLPPLPNDVPPPPPDTPPPPPGEFPPGSGPIPGQSIPHAPHPDSANPTTRPPSPRGGGTEKAKADGREKGRRFLAWSPRTELEKLQKTFTGVSSIKNYRMGDKLGEGTFGVVTKATEITTKREVALKKILSHNPRDGAHITTLREIKVVKSLTHPNVVPILDMIIERKTAPNVFEMGEMIMVLPYMDHDLCGLLGNTKFKLAHSRAKLIMRQILEGMAYIHANNIIHRDIKTANILVDKHCQIKIADFGLARSWTDNAKLPRHLATEYTNMVVTRWYRAPELLLGTTRYGPEVDIWSIGCVLGEIYLKRPILAGGDDREQLSTIVAKCGPLNNDTWYGWETLPGFPDMPGYRWDRIAREGKGILQEANEWQMDRGGADLLVKLLSLDPKKRPTASEALDHPWFWIDPKPEDPSKITLDLSPSHEMTAWHKEPAVPAQRAAPHGPPPQRAPPPHHQQYPQQGGYQQTYPRANAPPGSYLPRPSEPHNPYNTSMRAAPPYPGYQQQPMPPPNMGGPPQGMGMQPVGAGPYAPQNGYAPAPVNPYEAGAYGRYAPQQAPYGITGGVQQQHTSYGHPGPQHPLPMNTHSAPPARPGVPAPPFHLRPVGVNRGVPQPSGIKLAGGPGGRGGPAGGMGGGWRDQVPIGSKRPAPPGQGPPFDADRGHGADDAKRMRGNDAGPLPY